MKKFDILKAVEAQVNKGFKLNQILSQMTALVQVHYTNEHISALRKIHGGSDDFNTRKTIVDLIAKSNLVLKQMGVKSNELDEKPIQPSFLD